MWRTRAKKRAALLTAAILVPLTGTACAGPSTGTPNTTGIPAATGTPVDGGVIEYGHEQEPPCAHAGWVQNAYLARQYLDNLVSEADDGTVVPWLATGWDISPDRRSYTFHLRDDVEFTDGTRLDAAAVKYNMDRYLNEKTANTTVVSYLKPYFASDSAVDDFTYRIDLRTPYEPLLTALSQGYFGIQSPTALERGPQINCTAPVGSGPFILKKWERNRQITFVRNPKYNSAPANARHQGPPYVDKLIWKFLKDPVSRYGSLTSGSSDAVYNVPVIDWADAATEFQLSQYLTGGRPNTISMNVTHAPFDDVRVRRAFAHSADRRTAVRTAFRGVIPFNGNGALSSSTPDYDPAFDDTYRHDPATAARLLDEAGWNQRDSNGIRTKNGKPLHATLVYAADAVIGPEGAAVLQDIAAQARDVGFDIQLVPATQSEYFGGKYAPADTFNGYVGYWTSPTAGLLYINWRQRLPDQPNPDNTAYYNNPELQHTIELANSTADPAGRRRYYSKAQQIISDQAVSIGLYPQTTSIAVSPRLRDVWIEKSQGEPVFADARFIR
ncbi:ABC transporter substrate-binding protein [Nocardia vermiculata]|uniref:ABC transporter substrate-binding protein n=1 Tax=Nocardia vermiculata TaxID=257274 RepID=A0A846XXH7_9NOCA|nr:ABC transporter substrate-binding protein [Nocardia vermiculata]NKY51813.1 ABC transporter substrate-binding protein [Nocardia vermiculata]